MRHGEITTKITSVYYSVSIDIGSHSNERMGFTAQIGEDDNIKQVVEQLRQKVIEHGGISARELFDKILQRKNELRELEQKVRSATHKWDATAEFLRAQGIKPEASYMPQFDNLLPVITEETSGIIDGEVESNFEGF